MNPFDQAIRLYIGNLAVEMLGAQVQRDALAAQLAQKTTEAETLKVEAEMAKARLPEVNPSLDANHDKAEG